MTLKRKPVRKMPRAKGMKNIPKQLLAQDKAQIKHYRAQQKAKMEQAKKQYDDAVARAKKLLGIKKGETKRGIGPAGGAPVSKKTGKVFTGPKGTKRSIGPAGAPVSKTTGKVFTGKKGKARKPKEKLYPKLYSKLFGKKPLTT